MDPERRFYPELGAGGFTRSDGAIEFYTRVRSLLTPEDRVLDFGAGRGWSHHDEHVPFRAALVRLDGACARLVGVDVDPAVLENPGVHEAHVVGPTGPLPFPDGHFDLIVADHVFEHLHQPAATAAELDRVLRPGGWLCARTPNKWGYIAVAARLVPKGAHRRVLGLVQPGRKVEDVFATRYLLNSASALESHFPKGRWSHHSYTYDSEPRYAVGHPWLWLALWGWTRIAPASMAATRLVFLNKVGPDGPA